MKKKWYLSKTIWVNVLTSILAVVAIIQPEIASSGFAPILAAVAAGANIALRLVTSEAIE